MRVWQEFERFASQFYASVKLSALDIDTFVTVGLHPFARTPEASTAVEHHQQDH